MGYKNLPTLCLSLYGCIYQLLSLHDFLIQSHSISFQQPEQLTRSLVTAQESVYGMGSARATAAPTGSVTGVPLAKVPVGRFSLSFVFQLAP